MLLVCSNLPLKGYLLVAAFSLASPTTTSPHRRSVNLGLTSLQEDDTSESLLGPQLWLDLRGTAVVPRAALSLLDEDDMMFLVDRVLVSEQDAHRTASFWKEGDPQMLIVSETDGTLCSASDEAECYGTSFLVEEKVFLDPLPALDTVSNGGWAFVDTDEASNEESRQEAMCNLVSLLSSSGISSGASLQLGSGLLLDSGKSGNLRVSPYANDGKAGLAVTCRTTSDVVKMASVLQVSLSGGVTSTDSGILLQSDSMDASNTEPTLSSALVLPFEIPLWKAASYVLGKES